MNENDKFYNVDEIIKIIKSNDRLVYVDDGAEEVVVRFDDLPDFIVDMYEKYQVDSLKVYRYPASSLTPIITTRGFFLNRCDQEVRKEIIDRLVALQTGEIEIKDYKIIDEYLLDDARDIVKSKMKVEILSVWKTDYDDIKCNAILYENGKPFANIIESFDLDINDKYKEDRIKEILLDDFEKIYKIPKLSKTSRLMKEIYDNVCNSDSSMCHISDEDWKEHYADRYSNKDVEKLKQEVKKYGLENVLTFDNDDEYKIIGWGDLETRFNDDRKFVRNKERER